jgi:hypothetical protein
MPETPKAKNGLRSFPMYYLEAHGRLLKTNGPSDAVELLIRFCAAPSPVIFNPWSKPWKEWGRLE